MAILVCTIELDKNAGLTVTIQNDGASTTQTIKMDGTTIELKVAGPAATSTVTQSAEKVSVKCKQFEVIADETISLKSTMGSTWKSDQTIELEALQKVSASTPGSLALEGKMTAMLSSPQVTIKADAVLQLESSAMAALKGALTSVQGNLVTIG